MPHMLRVEGRHSLRKLFRVHPHYVHDFARMVDRGTIADDRHNLAGLPLVGMDGGQSMKWVWRLFYSEIGFEEAVPVQLIAEHQTTELYWTPEWCPDDILYDIRLVVIREPGPQTSDIVWMLRCYPRTTFRHDGVALTWWTSVDSVELPPVVGEKLESVGLHELVPHIVRLTAYINTYHGEPR